MVDQVTLVDGSVITDDTNPTTGIRAGGHRNWFIKALQSLSTWASQAQSYAAQAQAAAGAGGGTIFPAVTAADAGESLILNAAGTAYLADGAAKGFRNKLLNGDFQVWQRGTTFTDPTGIANMYTADRWAAFRGAWTAGITVTQQSVQVNSKSIRVQRNSGNTSTAAMQLNQSLETIDVKKLAGKTVALQLKALKGANFSAASSALTVQIVYGTGTDGNLGSGFTGQVAAGTLEATLTATNTQFTLTAAIPSNATQLAVQITYTPSGEFGAAGAADYFEVTDVQLEESPVATPFERRFYGLELSLCQRYFVRLVDKTGNHSIGTGVAISATAMQLHRYLGVEMRIAPALTLSGAANFICINSTGGTAGTATAITLGLTKSNFVRFDVSVASGLVAGNSASCQSQNTSATLDLSAEL